MSIVLKTPEGKKVVVNIQTDNCLYEAPHNPPNTGTTYTRGTDYYAHKARSGTMYFYSYSWSMWQGEEQRYQLMTDEEMREALIDAAGLSGPARMSDGEKEDIENYFPGIFDEDA
jgi:hypothetical protein